MSTTFEKAKGLLMEAKNGRVWELWLRVISVFILPWMAFVTVLLFSIDKRVAVIESNRFDSQDGLNVWRELGEKANKDEVPPQWLIDRIERIEEQDRIDHDRDRRP
jgi:hypothetical protein